MFAVIVGVGCDVGAAPHGEPSAALSGPPIAPSESAGQAESAARSTEDAASLDHAATAAVLKTFGAYKDAIVKRDGKAAADAVTPSTFEYYERVRLLALDAPEVELRREGVLDQMTVLLLRQSYPKDDLAKMTGRTLFERAVVDDRVGAEVAEILPGQVVFVAPDRREARLGVSTASGALPPDKGFRFERIGEGYRMDILSIMPVFEPGFRASLPRIDPDEMRAIEEVVSIATKKPANRALWKPLRTKR